MVEKVKDEAGVAMAVLVKMEAIWPVEVAKPEASWVEKRRPVPMPLAAARELVAVPWERLRTSTIEELLESEILPEMAKRPLKDVVVARLKLAEPSDRRPPGPMFNPPPT